MMHDHHHEETWSLNDVFVSEKTIPGVKQYRTSMRDVFNRTDEMFKAVIPTIQGIVVRASDGDGNLLANQRDQTMRQVGELVQG